MFRVGRVWAWFTVMVHGTRIGFISWSITVIFLRERKRIIKRRKENKREICILAHEGQRPVPGTLEFLDIRNNLVSCHMLYVHLASLWLTHTHTIVTVLWHQ